MKILHIITNEGKAPLLDFLETLEPKLRQKIIGQFLMLSKVPLPHEPIVKHFTIEKYNKLYELRAKSKVMVRIIFTILDNNDILLLTPFIKKHKRNTMQSLDSSLKLLTLVNDGVCSLQEFY